ncbi:MAG: hypothetical protein WC310_02405 [Patescibacteria group bacterium]|jgi:hypothetical protein
MNAKEKLFLCAICPPFFYVFLLQYLYDKLALPVYQEIGGTAKELIGNGAFWLLDRYFD